MLRRTALAAVAVLAAAVFAAPATSHAALLNLQTGQKPDVTASNLNVSYNATAVSANVGILSFTSNFATQTTTLTRNNGAPITGLAGLFQLTMNIDHSGSNVTPISGILIVTGNIDGVPGTEVLFKSTSVTDFGFDATGRILEFTFTSDGTGVLAPAGQTIGVIATGTKASTYDPSFDTNFSRNLTWQADAFVPEPGALAPLMAGGLLLARRRRA
jgi:hypothetical protein